MSNDETFAGGKWRVRRFYVAAASPPRSRVFEHSPPKNSLRTGARVSGYERSQHLEVRRACTSTDTGRSRDHRHGRATHGTSPDAPRTPGLTSRARLARAALASDVRSRSSVASR